MFQTFFRGKFTATPLPKSLVLSPFPLIRSRRLVTLPLRSHTLDTRSAETVKHSVSQSYTLLYYTLYYITILVVENECITPQTYPCPPKNLSFPAQKTYLCPPKNLPFPAQDPILGRPKNLSLPAQKTYPCPAQNLTLRGQDLTYLRCFLNNLTKPNLT